LICLPFYGIRRALANKEAGFSIDPG